MGTHPLAPTLAAVCLLTGLASAAAGATAAVKGTLAGATGEPLSGTYLLSFSLRDGAAETWSESLYVKARGGAYSVILGATKPLPSAAPAQPEAIAVAAPAGTGWVAGPLSPVSVAAAPVTPREVAAAAAPPAAAARTPAPPPAPTQARAAVAAAAAPATRAPARRARPAAASVMPAPLPAGLYEVQPGDTLRSVAQKVYGDSERWVDIYNANDDRVQRGGDLLAGTRLIIPRREK